MSQAFEVEQPNAVGRNNGKLGTVSLKKSLQKDRRSPFYKELGDFSPTRAISAKQIEGEWRKYSQST